MNARDLFKLVIPGEPSMSPDGRLVAYSLRGMDAAKNTYRAHVFLAPAGGGEPVQLTRGEQEDHSPAFSPDGRHIAFISTRQEKTNIWVIPVGGGEARALTSFEAGAIHSITWSPNGREIAFMRRDVPKVDPEKRKLEANYKHITRLHYRLDGMGFYGEHRWHIWKVAFPSGRVKQLTRGTQDDGSPAWSPDGRRLLFVSNRLPNADLYQENSDLFMITREGRGLRQITRHKGLADAPAWSDDGQFIYFIGNFAGPGEWIRHPHHVYRMSARGGRMKDLMPGFDQWLANGVISDTANSSAFFIQPYRQGREERLAVVVNEKGGCRLYSLPAAGGKLRPEMADRVNVLGASVLRGSGYAAVTMASTMSCGNIFVTTLDGSGKRRRLTELNAKLFASLDLTEPEEVAFRNGRLPIQGWILRPPGFDPHRRYPMILQIHGGPMAQYGYTFFHEMHLLAAQGYVVVFTNPRGSSGRGLAFMNSIERRWGTVDYDDLMAITDTMAAQRWIDRRRMGVAGGSYGGFMTTWIVSHTDRFKAAVTMRQAGNLLQFFGASDFGYLEPQTYRKWPWEDPMVYLRRSPNFYAHRIHTPLLITHSENDLRCPIAQAEELFATLKVLGRTVEFIRFEGESHGLSRGGKPQNRLERLNRIVDWFERYL